MSYIDPPTKLLYHIDRIAAIGAGQTPPPVNVEIDLSNRCGLGCLGCHMAHTHSRGPHARKALPAGIEETGDLMNTGLALETIKQLTDYGVRSITWTGGGEPLLHPDAVDIFSAVTIDQGLYTNGTGIDPLKAAVLKRVTKWIVVSLDQGNRYDYMQYKQTDQFEKAIEGVRALVRAMGEATIGVSFLLNADNWGKFGEMKDLALNSLNADYVQFRPLVVPGSDTSWVKPFLNSLAGWEKNDRIIIDPARFQMYRDWQGQGYPLCYWARMQSVITPDGRLWTCVNRRGFEGDCLGDLNTETFSAIWERSKAREVDSKCRTLCRGHLPNLSLNKILGEKSDHWRFI